ncbi:50S ribosomal protein L17 [Myxococcota bacterium]|nr:50S ribosomal protein L17 [Myxococcota bacterium]
MRHRNAGRKLSRSGSHRAALFSNLANALIEHGRIKTTDAKAKELRRFAERLVTLGKKNTLHARRLAYSRLRSEDAVQKLFGELAERFKDRHGGYTRIMKIGNRHGDNAPMSFIEFLGYEPKKAEEGSAEA